MIKIFANRGAAGFLLVILAGLLLATQALSAEPLAAPEGSVILKAAGKISRTNVGKSAHFDRAMLEAMGVSELSLETPWTDGRQTFSGVLASKVLDAIGAKGDIMIARAINDYEVRIPVSDLRRYPVIFALKQNGEYMRVRGKGPIWIIYPVEQFPELDTSVITDRWVWQLSEIDFE